MINTRKIATCILLGTLAVTGRTMVAKAEEVSEIPVAGITVLLDRVYETNENADETISQYFLSETASKYTDLAFAQVNNYVNIRNNASESSEIIGKLYDSSVATILDKKGDWYQIKSGSVTGYIKADYLLTGKDAKKLIKTAGTRLATVTTTTLKVREKASLNAEVLTLVPSGEELKVMKETDDWIKVSLDGNTSGFVSGDYVKLWNEYEEAISIEEEQERLEQETAARQDRTGEIRSFSAVGNSAQTAVLAESSSSSSNTQQNVSENASSSEDSGNDNNTSGENTSSRNDESDTSASEQSSLRSRIVSFALQFEGNPYVWGGTSLTNGADCSGYTQSIFAHFGIYIPRTSRTQALSGQRVSVSNLQPGDLIFYTRSGRINHVALYIGNGKVISASSASTGIRITNYNYRPPYKAVSYLN